MGRSITQAASSSGAVDLNPALQYGTPKLLANGESRACYAMLSKNNTSGVYGVAFYDRFFHPVTATPYDYSNPCTGRDTNLFSVASSTNQNYGQIFANAADTASNPGSGSGVGMINATFSAGEFGNTSLDVFSNKTVASPYQRSTAWSIKHYANRGYINSDHTDRSIAYVLLNGYFRAISRIDGDPTYDRRGTTGWYLNEFVSMFGSLSYNNVRKELIGLIYNSSGGSYFLRTWKNIDFDKYPSPSLAFNDAAVTTTIIGPFNIGGGSNWSTNDSESYYSLRPVLTDDGTIFVTVMFTSSAFTVYNIVRNAAATAISSTSYLAQYGLTTSYGQDQNLYYGQRQIQSRDGGAVMSFCCYYYYGAGLYSFVIDRRKNTYIGGTMFNSASTSFGLLPVPYGDDGFATFYAGNGYASNYTGNYITGTMQRNGSGSFQQSGTNIYLPYHTGPNTTNYPGFTQVVDYSMLTGHNTI